MGERGKGRGRVVVVMVNGERVWVGEYGGGVGEVTLPSPAVEIPPLSLFCST